MAKRDNQKRNDRPDHHRGTRMTYERNRQRIIASQDYCALCGQPVDKTLKYPHPLSASVDHIIPISRGGDPISLDNMQLTHLKCNMKKNNKMQTGTAEAGKTDETIGNKNLPWTFDWLNYRSSDDK